MVLTELPVCKMASFSHSWSDSKKNNITIIINNNTNIHLKALECSTKKLNQHYVYTVNQKNTQNVFVTSSTEPNRFWQNLAHIVLSKFVVQCSCYRNFYFRSRELKQIVLVQGHENTTGVKGCLYDTKKFTDHHFLSEEKYMGIILVSDSFKFRCFVASGQLHGKSSVITQVTVSVRIKTLSFENSMHATATRRSRATN